jgi:cytidylate kinase
MAVITISRQYGSGGDEIAARLYEFLGYRYFDKELMAQVAAEEGLITDGMVDFSEDNYQVRSVLERLFGISRPMGQATMILEVSEAGIIAPEVARLNEAESISLVQGTIQAAYRHDNMVIVGRGGQVLLRDKPNVLHVRVIAPLDDRVQRLHERANFSLGGAQDAALKRDRASAEYLKRFYDVDWADPMLYDLVVNTGTLGTEGAVQLILQALDYLPSAEPIELMSWLRY